MDFTHLVALLVGLVIGLGAGFWGRKKWGKDSPETLAAADSAAKNLGDRWGR